MEEGCWEQCGAASPHWWACRRQRLPGLASCLCISAWQRRGVFVSQPRTLAENDAFWSSTLLWLLQKINAAPSGDGAVIHPVWALTPCARAWRHCGRRFARDHIAEVVTVIRVPCWHSRQPSACEAGVPNSCRALHQELQGLPYVFIAIIYLFFNLLQQDAESLNITQQVF